MLGVLGEKKGVELADREDAAAFSAIKWSAPLLLLVMGGDLSR